MYLLLPHWYPNRIQYFRTLYWLGKFCCHFNKTFWWLESSLNSRTTLRSMNQATVTLPSLNLTWAVSYLSSHRYNLWRGGTVSSVLASTYKRHRPHIPRLSPTVACMMSRCARPPNSYLAASDNCTILLFMLASLSIHCSMFHSESLLYIFDIIDFCSR
jgi:hypothetical protein